MTATPQEFVTVWMQAVKEGHSSKWIAEKLGMNRAGVRSRAGWYRKVAGVALPHLQPGRHRKLTPEDVAALAAIVGGEG